MADSSSFSSVTPTPPTVTSIGNGIFQIPTAAGDVVSFTVPANYNLYVGSVAPDATLGNVGDWYQWNQPTQIIVYQKTAELVWTVETSIISAVSGGDVVGPASAGIGDIALFDGVTGKIIKDSGVTIAGSGAVANLSQVPRGNDPRMTDARTPTGSAGGDLAGTYPNPTLAVNRIPYSLYSAKGTLVVGTGVGTASGLAVGANGTFLIADSTQATGVKWASASGLGDVFGPASAVNTGVALFDGTSGKLLKDGGVLGTAAYSNSTAFATAAQGTKADNVALVNGIVKCNGAGTFAAAVAGDFPTLNQNTTGSAAKLTTARNIYGNSFDGTASVSGIIGSTFGGTGNAYTKFTGPTTTEKTFTLPDSDATLHYDGCNAIVGLLVHNAVDTAATVSYPSGGNVQLRFDLGNFAYIGLTVNISLSPSGSYGMVNGRWQHVVIKNTTGGNLTLTTNPSWVVAGNMPTTLAAGAAVGLLFEITGTLESDVNVSVISSASGGAAVGVPTAGSKYSRLRKDISGTITASSDMSWAPSDVYNVKDYGALGTNSGDDSGAINAALAAAKAAGGGAIYFPQGKYRITSAIAFASAASGRYALFGDGPGVSVISQATAATDAIYLDLSSGTKSENLVDVYNLGFTMPNGVTPRHAVSIDYGAQHNNSVGTGSSVHHVMITQDSGGGGYVKGIVNNHGWFFRVHHVFGWGSATTYDDNNGSHGGNGPFIHCTGGVNSQICNVMGNYFYSLVKFDNSGSDVFQGILMSDLHGVQCPIMIDLVGGAGCGGIDIVNAQLDNGNIGTQSRATFLRASTVNEISLHNIHSINNASSGNTKPLEVTTCNGLYVTNSIVSTASAGTLTAFALASVTRGAITGCSFSGFSAGKDVTFDASTSWVRVRDCLGTSGLALCTDSGSNNFFDANASATWDPANLAPAAQDFKDISVYGAAFGQGYSVGVPYDLQNMIATANVFSSGTVRITLTNTSNATVNLGSGTWTVARTT